MTLPKSSALTLVCGDSWSNQTKANVVRQVFATPALQMSDLETWCRERDMRTEVRDDDYHEHRLRLIDL